MTGRAIFREEAEKIGASGALIVRAFAYADSTIPKSERQSVDRELPEEVAECLRNVIRDYLEGMMILIKDGSYDPQKEWQEAVERN